MASRIPPAQPRRPKRASETGVEVLLVRDNAAELAKVLARREAAAEHQEVLAAAVHRKRSADAQEHAWPIPPLDLP